MIKDAKKLHWVINIDTLQDMTKRGVIVFEDRTYMADGPKKWQELKKSTRSANFIALFRHSDEATKYIKALQIVEELMEMTGVPWRYITGIGIHTLLENLRVEDKV
ncbi:hypothetical protein KAR91_00805 [Candidatus Pacearchaeota archaeon]|nr:hypothetical protein [Candidatus Pacearchaeota archaeon]